MIKVGDNEALVYNSIKEIVILCQNKYAKNWYTFDFYKNCEYIKNGVISFHAKLNGNSLGHNTNGEKTLAGKTIKEHNVIYEHTNEDDQILNIIENHLEGNDCLAVGDTYCQVMCPPTRIKKIIIELEKLEKINLEKNEIDYTL